MLEVSAGSFDFLLSLAIIQRVRLLFGVSYSEICCSSYNNIAIIAS